MKVTFWGTRGSIPVPGPETVRYGGNTACVSVRTNADPLFIFDAGTGIRNLGKHLVSLPTPGNAVLFLSHSHWDHIQGFPMFAAAYHKDFTLRVLGCPSHPTRLHEILARQQHEIVFPVPLEALRSNIIIGDYCVGKEQYDDVCIRTLHLDHPGGSCGFRLEEKGRVLVYMTDNELPADGEKWDRCVSYAQGADLLIHDAQYTDEELPSHKGWGHSSITQATQLALDARVKKLALFHHDPDRNDGQIDALAAVCNAIVAREKGNLTVFGAEEGTTLEI